MMVHQSATLRFTPHFLPDALQLTLGLTPDSDGQRVAQREITAAIGNALDALGRNNEALDAFVHAVDVDPNNGLSQRNLALQYLQANDFDNAVAHARAGVRLTPNDADAHNLLGLALIGQQKVDDAIAEFRTSLRLRPTNNDASGYLERTLKALSR
jgi:tetratricopeptide (TPR) repeat protein